MKTVFVRDDITVLVVEDALHRIAWFRERLLQAHYADNPADALRILKTICPQVVFLDFDLARGSSSRDVANRLSTFEPKPHVVIHSLNWFGAAALKRVLPWAHLHQFETFEIVVQREGEDPLEARCRVQVGDNVIDLGEIDD